MCPDREHAVTFVIDNQTTSKWQPRNIEDYALFPEEERLYPAGGAFVVTDRSENDGKTTVHLKLLERGLATVNAIPEDRRWGVLHQAVWWNKQDILKKLLCMPACDSRVQTKETTSEIEKPVHVLHKKSHRNINIQTWKTFGAAFNQTYNRRRIRRPSNLPLSEQRCSAERSWTSSNHSCIIQTNIMSFYN
ncbi:unnamed protein product [Mytilus edulis]|uniref:Uncharacterized protein n=1 Tax=Mytilus edulis TaxID=6550 RepID=A0A8S3RMG7_MYTED|nr:unnamed protein product [Mytilus edulis]